MPPSVFLGSRRSLPELASVSPFGRAVLQCRRTAAHSCDSEFANPCLFGPAQILWRSGHRVLTGWSPFAPSLARRSTTTARFPKACLGRQDAFRSNPIWPAQPVIVSAHALHRL